jgi:L-cysteate sulfo-lyase
MTLEDLPRVPLAHLPTPFEPLPRLSEHLGGPQIWIKRDDQTGLALGGNKARKLEYLAADALASGCDTLVTTGGPQSNHARQTAAAAARLGLHCELILPRIVPRDDSQYEHSGNVLLDQLLGANASFPAASEFSQQSIDQLLDTLKSQGSRPYFIPVGGSTPLGAVGYARAADELLDQAHRQQIAVDAIVVPTGSAGTHAGILAGLIRSGHPARVQGIAVSATTAEKEKLVATLTRQTLELLKHDGGSIDARVRVDDRFVGPGYGLPTDAMIDAVRLVARLEGLLLDPVYTGKAMAGLIEHVREGNFKPAEHVVFWHTGGTPALFAYQSIF